MYFISDHWEEHYVSECPLCRSLGCIYKEKVALRGELFVKENVEEDCILCLGEGVVEVVDKPIESDRKTEKDTKQSYLYRRGSTLF